MDEITLVGFLGKAGNKIDYFDLFFKASVRSIRAGSRNDFESMHRFIEARGLIPVVDRVFPFEEAQEAFEYLESQKFSEKLLFLISKLDKPLYFGHIRIKSLMGVQPHAYQGKHSWHRIESLRETGRGPLQYASHFQKVIVLKIYP